MNKEEYFKLIDESIKINQITESTAKILKKAGEKVYDAK